MLDRPASARLFWDWIDRERRPREREISAVDAALTRQRQKPRACPGRGGEAVPWVEAAEAARRAESLLGDGAGGQEGGNGCTHFWRTWFASRRGEDAEKDHRLVERLAAVLNDLGAHNDEAKADAEYAAAFRAYGVDLDESIPRRPAGRSPRSRVGRDPATPSDQWAIPARAGTSATRLAPERLFGGQGGRPRPVEEPAAGHARPMDGGPARRLKALELLAATADVERLPWRRALPG